MAVRPGLGVDPFAPYQWRSMAAAVTAGRVGLAGVLLVLLEAGRGVAGAQEADSTWTIGRIYITPRNVFDTAEDARFARFPYSLLNRLHVPTRPHVIERELLFSNGEPYDRELAEESARNLRRYPFLGRVQIRPVPRNSGGVPSDTVDVLVTTGDQWTTKADVVIDHRGNLGRLGIGLEEENLVGLGKYFNVRLETSTDRDLWRVIYRDPRLLGSRWSLNTRYLRASDGHLSRLILERPLYALSTTWSMKATLVSSENLDRLYDRGTLSAALVARRRDAGLALGRAWRQGDGQYELSAELSAARRDFPSPPDLAQPDSPAALRLAQAGPAPRNDLTAGLAWSLRHVRYTRRRYIDHAGLVEDIRLGPALTAGLGWTWGLRSGTGSYAAARLEAMEVAAPGGVWLTAGGVRLDARLHRRGADNGELSAFLHQYYQGLPAQTIAFGAAYHHTWEMDQPFQLVLGEDVGLRGYPARQFTGSHLVLLNLEDRVFTPVEIGTLRLGFAPFTDAGMAWQRGQAASWHDLHSSVGLSVRLAIPKFADGPVLRVDVAVPLRRAAGGSRYSVGLSFSPIFRALKGPEDRVAAF